MKYKLKILSCNLNFDNLGKRYIVLNKNNVVKNFSVINKNIESVLHDILKYHFEKFINKDFNFKIHRDLIHKENNDSLSYIKYKAIYFERKTQKNETLRFLLFLNKGQIIKDFFLINISKESLQERLNDFLSFHSKDDKRKNKGIHLYIPKETLKHFSDK